LTKREVLELIKEIVEYYPNFIDLGDKDALQRRIDAWHRILGDYEQEAILNSLAAYVVAKEYPPKIADLVKGIPMKDPSYNIPDVAATKEIMKRYEPAPESERLTPEQAKQLVYEKLGWRV
jgi:hypothetical protein